VADGLEDFDTGLDDPVDDEPPRGLLCRKDVGLDGLPRIIDPVDDRIGHERTEDESGPGANEARGRGVARFEGGEAIAVLRQAGEEDLMEGPAEVVGVTDLAGAADARGGAEGDVEGDDEVAHLRAELGRRVECRGREDSGGEADEEANAALDVDEGVLECATLQLGFLPGEEQGREGEEEERAIGCGARPFRRRAREVREDGRDQEGRR
jgi:hypothetical protein